MLHVGIIGVTHEGASLFVRELSRKAEERYGAHNQPEMTLHAFPRLRYLQCCGANMLQGWAELLLESVDRLQAAGAEMVACPSNTAHLAYSLVAERSSLPWVHIADVVATEARSRGYRRVGLLGTQPTLDAHLFDEPLGRYDIRCVKPCREEREGVHRIIRNELVHGTAAAESVRFLEGLLRSLASNGCDAVVLACTELPLVLRERASPVPLLDSLEILADATVREAARPSVKVVGNRGPISD